MKRLLFFAYTIFLLGITYLSYYFVDPNLHYLQWFYLHFKLQSQEAKVVILFLLLLIFFSFYIAVLWLYQKKRINQRDGVILIIMTALCLLFAYPAVYSFDIFNYLATAKVAFFYRENPYIIMPIEFAGDPMLSFMHAPNKVALYGPGWILLTFMPFLVGGGNFLLTLFSLKALVTFFYLSTLYIMYKLSKNFFAVLFFGLNPLVVIETLWSSHNDIVMMAFLLAGFSLYFHKRQTFGFLFYVFSVLTKYITVVLLPIFLFLKYTHKGKTLTQAQLFRPVMYGMIFIFLLSTVREEIYPWYAIWFLPFIALVGKRNEKLLAILFTFCLELRYFPYMLFLTHFGMTPVLKIGITFGPLFFVMLLLFVKNKWRKTPSHYSR